MECLIAGELELDCRRTGWFVDAAESVKVATGPVVCFEVQETDKAL